MGRGRKGSDFDNVEDNSRPPPYEEINNIDEFEADRSRARPTAPFNQNHSASIVASPQTPSNSLLSSPISSQPVGDNFQNDFFQKPPKFLLYPSTSLPEDGSGREGHEKDFDDKFANRLDQPSTSESQIKPSAPPVFAVPQTQQYNTNNALPMSALQLTQQVNAPVPGCITDNFLPRYSQRMVCPHCKVAVHSVVQYVSGQLTHLVALAACWFTCCLACVPYFIDELKDAEHFCPQCRSILGYNRKKVF